MTITKPACLSDLREGLQFMADQNQTATRFSPATHCCFCGEKHPAGAAIGYAGEPCCVKCGKGGNGEPDESRMAYKGNL